MKVADNMDRHKISDEFEFQPDRTLDFWVTCPLVQKKNIFDLVWSIACLVLTESLWNLQITWTGIKSWMCSKSGKIRLLTLEFFCPWVPKNPIFDFVLSVACVICIQSLWNLQINMTDIRIFSKLDWATWHYLLWSYMPLIASTLGLRWVVVALLGNLFTFFTWL